jgi:hypothetical protein
VLSIIALWRAVRLFQHGGLVAFVFELNLLALEPTVRKMANASGWGVELPKNPPVQNLDPQCDATHGSIVTCPYNYAGRSKHPPLSARLTLALATHSS